MGRWCSLSRPHLSYPSAVEEAEPSLSSLLAQSLRSLAPSPPRFSLFLSSSLGMGARAPFGSR